MVQNISNYGFERGRNLQVLKFFKALTEGHESKFSEKLFQKTVHSILLRLDSRVLQGVSIVIDDLIVKQLTAGCSHCAAETKETTFVFGKICRPQALQIEFLIGKYSREDLLSRASSRHKTHQKPYLTGLS